MATDELGDVTTGMPTDTGELVGRLRAALGRHVVDASSRRRAEYSSDASNYRVVPEAVVFPRSADDVLTVVGVCRDLAVPVTVRGGGTSIAGNSVGPGVVLDMSRHLNQVVGIDPAARIATVQPGVVLDQLQRAAGRHGLRFGPDPSTHSRCTVGGMIGNNSCGAHAMSYGTTAANVVSLDVIDGGGRYLHAGPGGPGTGGTAFGGTGDGSTVPGLDSFIANRLMPISREFGRFRRQVSGYSLEHLLPERGGSLARALTGTEGTCCIILGATVSLVPLPAATALCVLGYPDMPAAADDAPGLAVLAGPAGQTPLALEGIDARLVNVVRAHRARGAVPPLPAGDAWLFVEVGGSSEAEAMAAARSLVASAAAVDSLIVPAGPEAALLWRIREDGSGLGSRTASGAPAWPAWEDAAVPPSRLGPYLREFLALLDSHQLDGLIYGHFGDGCLHVRIDLPLADHPERLRPFLVDAAGLVTRYGGSLSGEHGDGRARSELLPIMYSQAAIDAFAAFKRLFDPEGLLNPGVIVDPRPADADLRLPEARRLRTVGGFALTADGGDLTQAVHRCIGMGKCRADNGPAGGFMCPSFLATKDEKDSTRGRARVLQEMANGTLVRAGWHSPEVHEALDLCLSCKACSRDCPVSVDMATYKSEVLHQAYHGRARPRSHYVLGWLPRWTRMAAVAPGLASAALRMKPVAGAVRWLGGIDPRRPLPALDPHPATPARLRQLAASVTAPGQARERVVVWADTFTRAFTPKLCEAAVAVLAEAGFDVVVPGRASCCGLTWISTGQLDGARVRLRAMVADLAEYAERGMTIVGLEPSCTAVLRGDLTELLDDPRAQTVAAATRTLAETLLGPDDAPQDLSWLYGRLAGQRVLAQPHCHQHAVMGYDADLAVLRAAGAHVDTIAGCCGLAGNFGMERGHYDVSVAVAEHALLPALRAAPEGTLLLADGFSCRTQASQLAGWPALHLAELLRV
ncbi:MAG TPA: FAD-binding and (Fe-S)-binding domain-containing protein [Streptosporangiaceae bacterium]